jgi:predicted nucleic acid-binding protein
LRTALDTNVISALWSGESAAPRLDSALFQARAEGGLVICAPVYCELLAHPLATRRFVDNFLHDTGIIVDFLLDERIWQQAATATTFAAYAERRRRTKAGTPKRLLVDFVIGSHALLAADRLMTLDATRYQSAFSTLSLI